MSFFFVLFWGNSDNFHDSAFTCFPSPSLLPRLSLVFPKILPLPPLVFFSSPSVLSSLGFFSQNAAFDCTGLDPRTPQPHSLPLPLSSASSPSLYLPPPQLTDNPMNESDERSETLREKGGEGEWERQHMYSPLVSLPLSLSLSFHVPPPSTTSHIKPSKLCAGTSRGRAEGKNKTTFFKKDSAWCCFFFCMCLCSSMLHYLSFSLVRRHTFSLCHAHTNTRTDCLFPQQRPRLTPSISRVPLAPSFPPSFPLPYIPSLVYPNSAVLVFPVLPPSLHPSCSTCPLNPRHNPSSPSLFTPPSPSSPVQRPPSSLSFLPSIPSLI